MSELMINNKEMRISSREVAKMMEEEKHSNLIRKIENINAILYSSKMSCTQYWIESLYIATNGKRNKEYLITKKGCELLAHKSTGEKGVLFTIKYMDKFEKMENELKNKQKDSYMIDDPIERAKVWIEEYEEKQILTKNILAQKEIIEEFKPKVDVYDEWVSVKNVITTTALAKDLGFTSAVKLNRELELRGIQYKKGYCWYLRAEYCNKGYTTYRTHVIPHANGEKEYKNVMYWTNAGKEFISNILKRTATRVMLENIEQTTLIGW